MSVGNFTARIWMKSTWKKHLQQYCFVVNSFKNHISFSYFRCRYNCFVCVVYLARVRWWIFSVSSLPTPRTLLAVAVRFVFFHGGAPLSVYFRIRMARALFSWLPRKAMLRWWRCWWTQRRTSTSWTRWVFKLTTNHSTSVVAVAVVDKSAFLLRMMRWR